MHSHLVQRPVTRLQISLIQIKICIASRGLWAVAIQFRSTAGFSWLFIIWTHSCSLFFLTDNLHLLDCSETWSLLMRTDADWTCWLTADARVRKHKHKCETDADSRAATPYTSRTLPTNRTVQCGSWDKRWQNSYILSSHAQTKTVSEIKTSWRYM